MTTAPYWHDATSAVHVGDARDVLADMPDGSADWIVTSPPFWGKRTTAALDSAAANPTRQATSPTYPPAKPGDAYRGSARPPKYGPHAREDTTGTRYGGLHRSGSHRRGHPLGRNPGDVWAIPARPHNGPHFASIRRCAASPQDANQAAPCSTRSPALVPPAWPPASSAAASPASNSTRHSQLWPLNASGMPPSGNRAAMKAGGYDRHAVRG